MAIVYILYSEKSNRFCTGSALDMTARLEDHLHKRFGGGFTTKAEDWKVFLLSMIFLMNKQERLSPSQEYEE